MRHLLNPFSLSTATLLLAFSIGCVRAAPIETPDETEPEPVIEVPRDPWTSARVIEDTGDLLRGPVAGSRLGDIIIENDVVAFVLRADGDDAASSGAPAGAIVDVALKEPRARDQLGLLALLCGSSCPAPFAYESVEIASEGGEGEPAAIVARGRHDCSPDLLVETRYEIEPGSAFIRISTTMTNEGDEPTGSRRFGDEIRWGGTRQWLPGHGFDHQGSKDNAPWVAGIGSRISYGWLSPGRDAHVEDGPGWSQAVLETPAIEPGESISFERLFIVGSGDGASLLAAVEEHAGRPQGVLTGIYREVRTSEPLAGGLVEVRDAGGRPFVTARTSEDGTFRLPLPPTEWMVASREPGRVSAAAAQVRLVAGGRADALVEATAAGGVEVLVLEQRPDPEAADVIHHFPIPSRITVHGVDGTLTPAFGPPNEYQGARNMVFLEEGEAELPLAPGRYRIRASRGLEYEIDEEIVDVPPGETVTVELRLRRNVDTYGLVSTDPHQHTNATEGSRVSRRARVVSGAAEGLDLILVTDRGVITDLSRPFANLDEGFGISWLPGVEIVSEAGHFGCFPVSEERVGESIGPVAGAPEAFETCRGLGDHAIVQVNHPRDSGEGYFNIADITPETGEPGFDAVEVMSGSCPNDTEEVMKDWFALLERGFRITGTGGSGTSCLLDGMGGYPRTYFAVEAGHERRPRATDLADSIRSGRVVVTSGPFPRLSARLVGGSEDEPDSTAEAGIGETLRVPAGSEVSFSVRVDAAAWVEVDRLVLVRGGEEEVVVDVESAETETRRHEADYIMRFDESGWVLLRVLGRIPSTPPGIGPDDGPLPASAFTNPIWIEVVAD